MKFLPLNSALKNGWAGKFYVYFTRVKKKMEKTHKTVINILKYKYIELYNNRKRTINDSEG